MSDPMSPRTADTLTRHLRSALRDADDPNVRYHIRHVLQYVEAERSSASSSASDADRTSVDGR